MTRFDVGDDRNQSTMFPERLEDYLSEDNPVRAVDVLSFLINMTTAKSLQLTIPASLPALADEVIE